MGGNARIDKNEVNACEVPATLALKTGLAATPWGFRPDVAAFALFIGYVLN